VSVQGALSFPHVLVEGAPIWPCVFLPQHWNAPLVRSAQVGALRAAIAATPLVRPATWRRRGAVGRRPIAQLTIRVGAPAPQRTIREQRAAEDITYGDGGDAALKTGYWRSRGAVGCRSIAKLTITVGAPATDAAVREQRAGAT